MPRALGCGCHVSLCIRITYAGCPEIGPSGDVSRLLQTATNTALDEDRPLPGMSSGGSLGQGLKTGLATGAVAVASAT